MGVNFLLHALHLTDVPASGAIVGSEHLYKRQQTCTTPFIPRCLSHERSPGGGTAFLHLSELLPLGLLCVLCCVWVLYCVL